MTQAAKQKVCWLKKMQIKAQKRTEEIGTICQSKQIGLKIDAIERVHVYTKKMRDKELCICNKRGTHEIAITTPIRYILKSANKIQKKDRFDRITKIKSADDEK